MEKISKDLGSYAPPKELQSKQIWTLVITGSKGEKVSEYNYTKKKMPLLTWPGVLKRYNNNKERFAPVTGLVSREVLTIDIDIKPRQPEEIQKQILSDLPPFLKKLVEDFPTLYHRSKSGKGWKIYYITDTPIPKNMTPFKYNGVPMGEIFQGMFVSTTDPELSDFSNCEVAKIDRVTLGKYIPEVVKELQQRKQETVIDQNQDSNEYLDMEKILKEVKRILAIIPVDPNPLLETVYETKLVDFECSSYHHWLLVSHTLADIVIKLSKEYTTAYDKLLAIFIEWSSTGQSFESEEDCADRFERSYNETLEALKTGKTIASFQTLRKLFWSYRIPVEDFPVIKINSRDNTKTADVTDPTNYEFLTNHLKISLVRDYSLGSVFVQGPVSVIKHYFRDKQQYYLTDNNPHLSVPFAPKHRTDINFINRLIKLYRSFGLKGVCKTHPLTAGLDVLGIEMTDTLFSWMNSVPWDKQPRVLDIISNSITLQESLIPFGLPDDFHYKLIFKHLIHMAGLRAKAYRAITHNPKPLDRFKKAQGMLILAGHQNARKSTWIECLLPAEVPFTVNVTPSTVKDTLEIQRALVGAFVFNIDEIDAVFDKLNLSDFKNVITQESDMFRTMYSQTLEKNPRAAGLFGTTNKTGLKLDRTGNRRFWIIPVKECDAKHLVSCNYQQFWAELLHYAENLSLEDWNIDEEEKKYINMTASQYTKQTVSGRTIDMAFTDENGESVLYDHSEFNFEGFFSNITQQQQRHCSKEGLFFAKRGNKAFVHMQTKFLMDDNIEFKLGPFEHELEDLISNLTGLANTTASYKNLVFASGVIQYYARGMKNPPQFYHFIPYKDKMNSLRAKNILPEEFFLK